MDRVAQRWLCVLWLVLDRIAGDASDEQQRASRSLYIRALHRRRGRAFCVRRRSSGEAGSATDLILSPRARVRCAF